MSQPANEDAVRFHQVVAEGNLEELRATLSNGADVNAPGHVGMTALMVAIGSKDLARIKLLIRYGADPELTDDFNHTALRHAVDADFADGVQFLLSLGVDRGFRPKYPLKKIDYSTSMRDVAMPAELIGVLSEIDWKDATEKSRQFLSEKGLNPTVEPAIASVQRVDVLRLFLNSGDDVNLAPTEVKRALLGLETGGELRVEPTDYQRHKSPRFGSVNPESMDNPFWREMIRTGGNAYSARTAFGDCNAFTTPGAVWCYERFGSSLTQLDDGRFVQIGGEHEDYYDPDFFIYNDVVVHDGRGDFQIFGYPREVFPPTDFHTATLCRDGIYIIGCLGYFEQRDPGLTSVFRLELESWRIESVKTTGKMPSWIHKHRAIYDPKQNAILISGGEMLVVGENGEPGMVPNGQQFELNLTGFQWRQIQ